MISAGCEVLGVTVSGVPLSCFVAYVGVAFLSAFVFSLWRLMSTLREVV